MSSFTEFASSLPPMWNTFILGPLWLTQFVFLAIRQLVSVGMLAYSLFFGQPHVNIFGWLLAVVFFLGNFAVWFMPLYEAHTYGVQTLTLDKYSKYQKWKTGWILAGWAVFLVFGMSLSAAKWDTWLTVLLEIVYLAPFLGSFAYAWKLRKENAENAKVELLGF